MLKVNIQLFGGRGAGSGSGGFYAGGGGGTTSKPFDGTPSQNPFVHYRKYQKDFKAASDIDELRAVLDANGVALGDSLVRGVKSGKINFNRAKEFAEGAVMTISHYGNGDSFIGITSGASGSTIAYNATDVAAQSTYIALNPNYFNNPNTNRLKGVAAGGIRGETTKSIGAHEGAHSVQAALSGKMSGQAVDNPHYYSNDLLQRVNTAYNKASGQRTNASVTRNSGTISRYAQKNSAEAHSEAMNDVFSNRGKASAFSKAIVKQMFRDVKKYR